MARNAKIPQKYQPIKEYGFHRESTMKENEIIIEHLRNQGRMSQNPLRMIMQDRKAMVETPDETDKNATLSTKGLYQVDLLKKLEEEDYDQVNERIKTLQSQLNEVKTKLNNEKADVNREVNGIMEMSTRRVLPSLRQRELSAAISTFNWSSSNMSTTNREYFDWKVPCEYHKKSVTQWGQLSKYGDDPCMILLTQKPKKERRKKP